MSGVNTRFDVPHSRFNEITKSQLDDAKIKVLVEGK
jgi:homoserine O-succinyltransferase